MTQVQNGANVKTAVEAAIEEFEEDFTYRRGDEMQYLCQ